MLVNLYDQLFKQYELQRLVFFFKLRDELSENDKTIKSNQPVATYQCHITAQVTF